MTDKLQKTSSANIQTVTTASSDAVIRDGETLVCNMSQRCKSAAEPSEFFLSINDLSAYKGNRAEMKRHIEAFLQSFFAGLEGV